MIHSCPVCSGSGYVGSQTEDGVGCTEVCPTCGGAGKFHLEGP